MTFENVHEAIEKFLLEKSKKPKKIVVNEHWLKRELDKYPSVAGNADRIVFQPILFGIPVEYDNSIENFKLKYYDDNLEYLEALEDGIYTALSRAKYERRKLNEYGH